MKTTMISTAIALALGFGVSTLQAQPATQVDRNQQQPVPQVDRSQQGAETRRIINNRDSIDADDFVEEVSAKNMAEINSARLALEEGGAAVKAYANKIIEDHTEINSELRALSASANLEVSDEATLVDRAKTLMLSVRDGQNFDEAYAENQINAHENSIELYQRATGSDNPAIASYASAKLPILQEHLRMANALKAQISSR